MSEPTGENPPQHEYPYGHDFFLLGLRAVDALYDLCDVPAGAAPQWVPSDLRALQGWFNVEEKAEIAFDSRQASSEQVEHVNDILFRYHISLPFDEAERRWLYSAYEAAWGPDTLKRLSVDEATITSAGIRRVVSGRELMERWSAWRRGIGQFQGHGGVDDARESLCKLIETVSPTLDLPEPYIALRSSDTGETPTT